ncbi:MAG: hypothetical protein ACLGIF_06160, partial [Actinomycetes bacterium]
ARGRPDLLAAAVREQTDHPDIDAEAAVDAAEALHESADEARAQAGRQRYTPEDEVPAVQPASRQLVDAALRGLKDLIEALRAGTCVSRYDTGSLELFAIELLELLGASAKTEAVA